jgi:glycosyltransferase involved in cell wall biosynthesis
MKNIRYFCRINTPIDEVKLGVRLHIGPAFKKVQAVAKAIATAHTSVSIVSVPVVRLPKFNFKIYSSRHQVGLVENRSYGAFGNPFLDRIYSAVIFLREAILARIKSDQVILYNFFPEYILAAIFLRISMQPAILDIEDAPRVDEAGPRGIVNRLSFLILNKITDLRKITVSRKVSEMLNLQNSCIIYGSVPGSSFPTELDSVLDVEKWNSYSRIKILYGGSLMPETGIEVFVAACKSLLQEVNEPKNKLDIHITGFGGEEYLSDLLKIAKNHPWLRIIFAKDLPTEEYDILLKSVHASLCLKIPGTGIGDTTFPSKVVEISGAGILLITTPVSDVPTLFNQESAVILCEPYADSLAEAMIGLLKNPENYKNIAGRGKITAMEYFEEKAVGKRIVNFVQSSK